MARKKDDFYDDGRTVADMSGVELFGDIRPSGQNKKGEELGLSKSENRAMLSGVLKATLLIAAVFGIAAFFFILFCVKVWFK